MITGSVQMRPDLAAFRAETVIFGRESGRRCIG
jgi:hypothetical protein